LDGEVATAETRDGQDVFKLWSPDRGTEREFWSDEESYAIAAAFSPDGKTVASASFDGTVRLGVVKTRELLFAERAHTGQAACIAFSPDGKTLVTGGENSELFFWNLRTYERQERTGPPMITSLAFSPDGHLAVGGGVNWNRNGRMMVWDLGGESPKCIREFDCPETVRSVAYSPNGTRMAITYKFSAGIIHLLDAGTLEKIFEFRGHSHKVTTLTFTSDGRRLITGSDDGTVRFWDLNHGKPVGTLRVGARVRNLAMSPDDNALMTFDLDGWLRLWRAKP